MAGTMKAVVYKEPGFIALEERDIPHLQEDTDVLLRVCCSTICSSAIHIKHGSVARVIPGTVLGHEFVGEVVEVGNAVKKFCVGDRASVNVEIFCDDCFYCKRGYVNNCIRGGCELGRGIDGGQSEFVRIPWLIRDLQKFLMA